MGAVFDAGSSSALDLYPHPPGIGQRLRRALSGANGVAHAGAALAILAVAWSASQFLSLRDASRGIVRARDQLSRDVAAIAPIRETAARRAARVQGSVVTRDAVSDRVRLAQRLATIASAVPAEVRFDTLNVARKQSTWGASLTGEVAGATAALTVVSLNQFFERLRSRDGVSNAVIESFDYGKTVVSDTAAARARPAGITLRFHIVFELAVAGLSGATPPAGTR
jgi:hypothetical protein